MSTSIQPVSVAAPVAVLPACPCKTTAECINWRYRQANEHAAIAIMAAIDAGRQLVAVKSRMVHGTWEKWIAAHLEFSKQTAQNLMKMYAKSVGAERAALPAPVGPDTPVSEDEFAAAREKYPATSPAAFLKALSGDRSANWGGDRRAAAEANGNRVGRPPLLPEGGAVPDGLHRAAAREWGRIFRLMSGFLARKLDLALDLVETTIAIDNARALVASLEKHKKELEKLEKAR